MEHNPTGQARVVVWPDAEHPKSPITVLIACSCGDDGCYWNVTDERPIHSHPGPTPA